MTELGRINDFLRETDEGASTRVERFELGLAFFHRDLPRVYDRNFLLVSSDADADSVAAAADELQGGAGLAHRKVVFEDERTGATVGPALGWEHRGLAVMVHRGEVDRDAGTRASEVDREALVPALEQLVRSEPWGEDPDVVRQLTAADIALERAIGQRCFARLVDGAVVSSCRVYSDGRIAQIEDVATVPGRRQRGYARDAVSRALEAAKAEHELVFLTAVDGRWVKRWYERLGFEQVGVRYDATRSA